MVFYKHDYMYVHVMQSQLHILRGLREPFISAIFA